jgi:hypothetical protein
MRSCIASPGGFTPGGSALITRSVDMPAPAICDTSRGRVVDLLARKDRHRPDVLAVLQIEQRRLAIAHARRR